jgi:hypothetical protein
VLGWTGRCPLKPVRGDAAKQPPLAGPTRDSKTVLTASLASLLRCSNPRSIEGRQPLSFLDDLDPRSLEGLPW